MAAAGRIQQRLGTHAVFARKQIDLRAAHRFEAPQAASDFWARIRDTLLAGNWFERLVVAEYAAYFRMRFGDLVDDDDFFSLMCTELFLQRHEPGFFIGPHTDLPTRIFTCIFSFADSDGFDEYGTQLMAHKDRLVRCSGKDHYTPEDFVVRKLVPYRPNNFCCSSDAAFIPLGRGRRRRRAQPARRHAVPVPRAAERRVPRPLRTGHRCSSRAARPARDAAQAAADISAPPSPVSSEAAAVVGWADGVRHRPRKPGVLQVDDEPQAVHVAMTPAESGASTVTV